MSKNYANEAQPPHDRPQLSNGYPSDVQTAAWPASGE